MTDPAVCDPLVIVVDDDEAIRNSVVFLLSSVHLSAQPYPSAEAFLADLPHVARERSGCILLDVRMPGMSGLELQRALNERDFRLPVIIVTGHGDVPMAVAALKAGAHDFIEKPYRDQQLLDAVHAAIAVSRDRMAKDLVKTCFLDRFGRLTRRERDVLLGVAQGKQNKMIAAELDISVKTVEVHRHAGMDKLAIGSAAELSRLVTLSGVGNTQI